jgi:hypothetical protein
LKLNSDIVKSEFNYKPKGPGASRAIGCHWQ